MCSSVVVILEGVPFLQKLHKILNSLEELVLSMFCCSELPSAIHEHQ